MIGLDYVHPFGFKTGFARGDFSRRFRTPNGITRRVLGVWVLPFLMHFNCCHLFQNTTSCRSLVGEKLTFMSRNGNLSFTMI